MRNNTGATEKSNMVMVIYWYLSNIFMSWFLFSSAWDGSEVDWHVDPLMLRSSKVMPFFLRVKGSLSCSQLVLSFKPYNFSLSVISCTGKIEKNLQINVSPLLESKSTSYAMAFQWPILCHMPFLDLILFKLLFQIFFHVFLFPSSTCTAKYKGHLISLHKSTNVTCTSLLWDIVFS